VEAALAVRSRVRIFFAVLMATLIAVASCAAGEIGGPGIANNPGDGGQDAGGEAGGECWPKSCAGMGAECGTAPNGCGGVAECGSCSGGLFCGGGGPNKCGTDPCTPKTCAQVDASCGYASDQCATAIDCGSCPAPLSCGGAGKLNVCGCAPKTCAQLGAECGTAPDGCGGTVTCGDCSGGNTCGGGGPNKCGTASCTPKTCAQASASCGVISDQCAATIDCGTCPTPQICGGGGIANQCGCVPKTCVSASLSCGTAADGCGGTLDCGVCAAANGSAQCVNGSCQLTGCDPGFDDCDGNPLNGCESNLQSDPNHCLDCATVCTAANGTPVCTNGVCGISSCNPGTGDCDANLTNGCETDTSSSALHCGFCDNACTYTNATGKCVDGACQLDACNANRGNCDANPDNGCEINTAINIQHCGGCGNACSAPANATPACSAGSCGFTCNLPFADCDGNAANGCEANTSSSVGTCGSCSNNCAAALPSNTAAATCQSGQSAVATCQAGFYDENKLYTDGCECASDAVSSSCSSALMVNPNPIGLGGSASVGPYTIVPAGDQDYFQANFSGNGSCAFAPKVTLNDASGLLRMDITTNCSSAIACGTSSSTAIRSWAFAYAAACGANQPIDPVKQASQPTSIRIRVYATGAPSACLTYTLSVSN
jgi:hypothetical protein